MKAFLGVALVALAVSASAQMMGAAPEAAPPVGVRGAIVSVAGVAETGQVLMIKTKTGATQMLKLAPKATVVAAAKVSLDAVGPNSFIGTTAEPGKDGALVATEVHVFPESMRGAGEGHRPWDTSKTSSMTNGNVGAVKEGGLKKKSGRTLTVDYKGGQQTVYVPTSVPIVSFAPGDASQLVNGASVFTFAKKLPDGSFVSDRVVVGVGGTVPPM